jgi:putative radical SAM enzyme (TIGR03279 family)
MRITLITPDSIASELGLQIGDDLISINGSQIRDELDLQFYSSGDQIELEIVQNGETVLYEIEKEYDEELGMKVEPMKMSACGNDCVFCFVDQNPEGLRKALYFRDGDYRFSHLYGNFNTMTNVGPISLERIVRQRLMPQYVSVHSTDLEVRKQLMRLRKDDKIMEKLRYLAENEIWMHGQIVLCPGINDGMSLDKTIEDVFSLWPSMKTLAVVPVGLTSHRLGLTELKVVDRDYARMMIDWAGKLQSRFKAITGASWLYLSDEFYLVAEVHVPDEDFYDGFPQLENGIGMVRDFIEETRREVNNILLTRNSAVKKRLTLATGTLAAGFMHDEIVPILSQIPNLEVGLEVVVNKLYGPAATVTGLLSGKCFTEHFGHKAPSDLLLLPPNVLNEDDIFLDDETPAGLQHKLGGRAMAIFHGSWEEVLHYLDDPNAQTFQSKRITLPVIQA